MWWRCCRQSAIMCTRREACVRPSSPPRQPRAYTARRVVRPFLNPVSGSIMPPWCLDSGCITAGSAHPGRSVESPVAFGVLKAGITCDIRAASVKVGYLRAASAETSAASGVVSDRLPEQPAEHRINRSPKHRGHNALPPPLAGVLTGSRVPGTPAAVYC